MAGTDKRKQSLYFPEDMLDEIQAEAIRLDRSLSWVVQRAWRLAAGEVGKFPSVAGHRVTSPEAASPAPAAAPQSERDREPSAQVREFIAGKFENG
jgi:uncharacterized small protein (TIGR04563 family)